MLDDVFRVLSGENSVGDAGGTGRVRLGLFFKLEMILPRGRWNRSCDGTIGLVSALTRSARVKFCDSVARNGCAGGANSAAKGAGGECALVVRANEKGTLLFSHQEPKHKTVLFSATGRILDMWQITKFNTIQ